ncbi:hypothetical protein P22_3662 [Propionispora sp. 2/2-37]|uniref:helix-turn-helix domain-containing protein n=1 Tax=Propionispora sp. 2/2-37 TaxID=1677858 RepID=UPI0006BB7519|nr:helix-turn-helix domain-containing protein [Propionispora sp. 2/2-37]CUH97531.1 hypothetical protein P22_3662 [Propionispora sp. 2/2-37]
MELTDVMTVTEAAERWGLDVSTLRYACIKGKFTNSETRKSGSVWLITYQGMERVYGKEKWTNRIQDGMPKIEKISRKPTKTRKLGEQCWI